MGLALGSRGWPSPRERKDLWPNGQFVTTHLIVSQKFLDRTPGRVRPCFKGCCEYVEHRPSKSVQARSDVNAALKTLTGKALDETVLARSWDNLKITVDRSQAPCKQISSTPLMSGISKSADLNGIYDLSILNSILTAAGKARFRRED